MRGAERRRHERTPFHAVIRLTWQDSSGLVHTVKGKAIDRSQSGMRLEATDPVKFRAVVQVQLERFRPLGLASVRYCARRGMRFVVGLEFTPGFRWQDVPAAGGSGL